MAPYMVDRAYIIINLSKDLRSLEHLIPTILQVKAANTGFFHPDLGFPGYCFEN